MARNPLDIIKESYNDAENFSVVPEEVQVRGVSDAPQTFMPKAPEDYMANALDESTAIDEGQSPPTVPSMDVSQAPEPALRNEIASSPLSRSEQLLQEYNKLMAKDREDLQAARSRDRMFKVGGAIGDALATYINAKNQMNVKAPGVQVQQGAGLGKIADMFATAPEIQSDVEQRRADLLAQFKALSAGDEDLTPYQKEMLRLRAQDQRLREQQLAGIGERFEKGLEFRKEEKNELSDKQLESIASFDKVNALSEDLKARAKEFKSKLGPYAPTIEQAKNYIPGQQEDPDWAAFKASTTDNLSQYIKSLSGLTVSDKERASLLQSVPKIQDKYDIYMSKMDELQKRLREYKNTELEVAKKYQGKRVEGLQSPTTKLSPKDEQALRWAEANPNDSRAAAIKQRLGR